MSLGVDLRHLQQLRNNEMERLRCGVTTLTEALASEPAGWVRAHPYLATGGAAVMGFLAAQVRPVIRSSLSESTVHAPVEPPVCIPAPEPAARDAAAGFDYGSLLTLVMSMAEQFLAAKGESSVPSPAQCARPSLRPGDGGTVAVGALSPIGATRTAWALS